MGVREEFENLPEIAKKLYTGIYWNDYQGKYQTDFQTLLATVDYLNGAWYVYQEQQKKIDSMLDHVCGKHEDFK